MPDPHAPYSPYKLFLCYYLLMEVKFLTLKLLNYNVENIEEFNNIGNIIDKTISKNFSQYDIAVRGLSLHDHPNLSLDNLIKIILEKGTDHYDTKRRMAVSHDFYKEKEVELFAVSIKSGEEVCFAQEMLEDFAIGEIQDRGYSLRIDLLVIYDLNKLVNIPIKYPDGIGKDAFRFKDAKRENTILGFIKIT